MMDGLKEIMEALKGLHLPLIRGESFGFPPPYLSLSLKRSEGKELLSLRLISPREGFFELCESIGQRLSKLGFHAKNEENALLFGSLLKRDRPFIALKDKTITLNGLRLYPIEFVRRGFGSELKFDIDGKTVEKPLERPYEYGLKIAFSKLTEELFYTDNEDFILTDDFGRLELKLREKQLKNGMLELKFSRKEG